MTAAVEPAQHPGFVATLDGAVPRNSVLATRRAAFTCPNRGSLVSSSGVVQPCRRRCRLSITGSQPAGRKVSHLIPSTSPSVQWQAAGQDQEILVVSFPQACDYLGHQLEHAAGESKAIDGRPVLIQPIEHLRVNWVGLCQPVVIAVPLAFLLGSFAPSAMYASANARQTVSREAKSGDRLEQSPPNDLERLFRRHRLPECLHAAEEMFECLNTPACRGSPSSTEVRNRGGCPAEPHSARA